MFRVIGGCVVYGFAVYGVVKFFKRRRWVLYDTDASTMSSDGPVDAAAVPAENGKVGE